MYKNNRKRETHLNGLQFPQNSFVLDEKGRQIFLEDIFKGNKLILRYSELNCDICIDAQLENLTEKKDQIGFDNIILLITSKNNRYIHQFKRINKIKFQIYRIPDDLDSIIPDIDIPYYFVLEERNLRINSAFVAQKELPELTEFYLNEIISKYFSN